MQGVRNQGGRSVIVRINRNTPQKKTSTQSETTIFCAAAIPKRFAVRSNATSNKILFHCFAMYSPGACPFSINCASQTLYTWLARSPASIRRCQQHGIGSSAEIKKTAASPPRENRQPARSLPSSAGRFSAKHKPHFRTPLRAAFYYYFLSVGAARTEEWSSAFNGT